MSANARTWHYGLVARWWAEFNQGEGEEEELAYFQRAIAASGEPVLDAGCGNGRLLLPLMRSGLDLDGSDASEDMLAWCRKRAEADGIQVNLYAQPMHALDLPRRYRTVIACGVFGVGGSRPDDLEGLRRIRGLLEPGGTLLMDYHFPKPEDRGSRTRDRPASFPEPWPEVGDRRTASDGTELEMRSRTIGWDLKEKKVTREIWLRQYRQGVEVASETNTIDICIYALDEVRELLEQAGFQGIRLTGALEERAPRIGEDTRIFFHGSP